MQPPTTVLEGLGKPATHRPAVAQNTLAAVLHAPADGTLTAEGWPLGYARAHTEPRGLPVVHGGRGMEDEKGSRQGIAIIEKR